MNVELRENIDCTKDNERLLLLQEGGGSLKNGRLDMEARPTEVIVREIIECIIACLGC